LKTYCPQQAHRIEENPEVKTEEEPTKVAADLSKVFVFNYNCLPDV
jgi:hypothetical protein